MSGMKKERQAQAYVSCEYVHTALGNNYPRLFVADACFEESQNEKGFLPNANILQMDRIISSSTLKVVGLDAFTKYVKEVGVAEDDHVVVYDSGEGTLGTLQASQIWYAFKTYSHPSVSVMHGGKAKWVEMGYELSHEPAKPKVGTFQPGYRHFKTLNLDEFMKSKEENDKIILIDVRNATQFTGTTSHSKALFGGHIQGALNIPVAGMLEKDKTIKTFTKINNYLEGQGVSKMDQIIIYCNTCRQTAGALLIMSEIGYNVQMYDGGWVEYSNKILGEK